MSRLDCFYVDAFGCNYLVNCMSAVKQLLELAKRVCICLVYKIEVYAKMSLSCYFYHSTQFSVCSLGGE